MMNYNSSMNPNVDIVVRKLIRILLEEITAYNHLLESLNRKQQAILSGEIIPINNAIEDEQKAIFQTREIDKKRKYALSDVQQKLNPDGDIDSLDTLIGMVEIKYRDRLNEIKLSLLNIVQKVTILNDQNKALLENSIKFVKGMVQEFVEFSDKDRPTYSPTGKTNSPELRNLLDRRI